MDRARLMKDKRRGKGPLLRSFVNTFAASVPAAMAVAAGCSHNDAVPPGKNYQIPPQPGVSVGPCSPEGMVKACDVNLGVQNNVQRCMTGTQTCVNGSWSSCGGNSGTVSGHAVGASHKGSSGLHFLAPVPPGTDCSYDPCDPYCQEWDSDAGAGLLDNGDSGNVVQVSGSLRDVPGGMEKRLWSDSCNGGGNPPPCDDYPTGSGGAGNLTFFACQDDFYCEIESAGGSGCCKEWGTGGFYPAAAFAPPLTGESTAVDLTIGPPCSATGARVYDAVDVCNRGSAALVGPGPNITLKFFGGNGPLPVTTCPPAGATPPDCSWPLAATLAPGTCVNETFATGGPGCTPPGGAAVLYVNADNSIAEGVGTLVGDPSLGGEANQDGCADNWAGTDFGRNNPPACQSLGPTVAQYVEDYTATCPMGSLVQWSQLTYQVLDTPNGSGDPSVLFEIQTAPVGLDGGTGAFTMPPVTIANATNTGDPDTCGPPISGSPTCTNNYGPPTFPAFCCPKDINGALQANPPDGLGPMAGAAADIGAPGSTIQLTMTLTSSPDGLSEPIVYWWQVSYSCVPSE